MCDRNWQMERTKFVLTQRNNDTFSGDAQNKGKNPSLQEKKHQYLDRYFKRVKWSPFFLNEQKKEEEEKLHEAAWLLTVKRKKRNWNCWNRLEIARQISLREPLYNFWIKETAEAH